MAKDNKTSKTARVMNLLSKKNDPAAAANDAPEAAAPAAPAAPVPPIVTSMAPDAAVSVKIKNALEDALENELGSAAPEVPAPQPEREPMFEPLPEPEPEPEPLPEQESPLSIEDFVALDIPVASDGGGDENPDDYVELEISAGLDDSPVQWKEPLMPVNPGYINVMQVLVEEKAPKYVQMFGLCSCERCMEDVKAYTLNHLPPKYVVLEPGDRIPRLTVYEGKLTSDITAQLLQACKVVMERPHHTR